MDNTVTPDPPDAEQFAEWIELNDLALFAPKPIDLRRPRPFFMHVMGLAIRHAPTEDVDQVIWERIHASAFNGHLVDLRASSERAFQMVLDLVAPMCAYYRLTRDRAERAARPAGEFGA